MAVVHLHWAHGFWDLFFLFYFIMHICIKALFLNNLLASAFIQSSLVAPLKVPFTLMSFPLFPFSPAIVNQKFSHVHDTHSWKYTTICSVSHPYISKLLTLLAHYTKLKELLALYHILYTTYQKQYCLLLEFTNCHFVRHLLQKLCNTVWRVCKMRTQ